MDPRERFSVELSRGDILGVLILLQSLLLLSQNKLAAGGGLLVVALVLLAPHTLRRIFQETPHARGYHAWLHVEAARILNAAHQPPRGGMDQTATGAHDVAGGTSDVTEIAFLAALGRSTGVAYGELLGMLGASDEERIVVLDGRSYLAVTPVGRLLAILPDDSRFQNIDPPMLIQRALSHVFKPVGLTPPQRTDALATAAGTHP